MLAHFQLDFRLRNFILRFRELFIYKYCLPFNQKNNPFFFPTLFKGHAKYNGRITVIEIDKDLKSLSAGIISRACFGSNYTQGEEIFLKLRTL